MKRYTFANTLSEQIVAASEEDARAALAQWHDVDAFNSRVWELTEVSDVMEQATAKVLHD